MTSTNKPDPKLAADLGTHVVLDLISDEGAERLELDLVPDQFADVRQGFLGISTPLAKAILGRRAGQVIPYRAGDSKEIRLVEVRPSQSSPSKEIADRRAETVRKAIDHSDRTNAMIFATSFSGKWGDYDPTGFEDKAGEEQEDQPPSEPEQ